MAAHDFDPLMQFCLGCGCSRMALAEGSVSPECAGAEADNVIAISHIARGRRFDAILNRSGELDLPGGA